MTGGGGEKTEKATPHKRREQRKKGNVFQSRDLISGAMILSSFLALRLFTGYLFGRFSAVLNDFISLGSSVDEFTVPVASKVMFDFVVNLLLLALPMLLVSMVMGFALSVAQTRFIFSSEPLRPKLSKLNPIEGFKRMFSIRSLVELVKSLLKVSVIAYIVYTVVYSKLTQIPVLMNMDILAATAWLGQTIFDVALYAGMGMLVIGVLDFFYQWWDYERKLRMSKQEIKEEDKKLEGNPETKSRIKSIQRQMAQKRMMAQVKDADVVIRNPQHYAVALRYKPEKDKAPVTVAKGKDRVALRIIEEAKKYEIYTLENPPLARALYAAVEIDQEIPYKFYFALADVITHLYNIKNVNIKNMNQFNQLNKSNKLKPDRQGGDFTPQDIQNNQNNRDNRDMNNINGINTEDMFNPDDYDNNEDK